MKLKSTKNAARVEISTENRSSISQSNNLQLPTDVAGNIEAMHSLLKDINLKLNLNLVAGPSRSSKFSLVIKPSVSYIPEPYDDISDECLHLLLNWMFFSRICDIHVKHFVKIKGFEVLANEFVE